MGQPRSRGCPCQNYQGPREAVKAFFHRLAKLTKAGSREASPFTLDTLIFSEIKAFEMTFNHSTALLVLFIKMKHWVLFPLTVSSFLDLKEKIRRAMVITLVLPLPEDPQTIFISHCKQLVNLKLRN